MRRHLSGLGRFITQDTYEGDIANPLSLNLYTYVLNNPLKYIDPTGHANMVGMMGQDGDPNLTYEGVMLNANGYYTGESSGNYHDLLDYVGLIPVIGDWADGINAIAYLIEGEYAYALLSSGSMVPIAGWASTGTKVTVKAGDKISDVSKAKVLDNASVFKAACNCFVGGTQVQTDEGEKNIEDIEVGDKVLSKDEETGELAYKEVTATFNHETDEIYSIHVDGQTIESTYNHPFYVKDKGWTFVKDLKVGDLLVQSDGNTLEITSIELLHKHVTVYNMTVDEFHTYFVSDLGIWVHNTSCNYKTGDMTPGGHSFSKHGAERANERGFTAEAIDNIINNNRKNRASKVDGDGNKTWEYTDARGNKVVTNESGGIISVHSPAAKGVYIPKTKK